MDTSVAVRKRPKKILKDIYLNTKKEHLKVSPTRDSVDLLGKCIRVKPQIKSRACKAIVERSVDTGVAVRKRPMNILDDIYLSMKRN